MSSTAERPATIETLNPATGEKIARYEPHDRAAVDAHLDAAVAAQRRWRETSFAERGGRLRAVAVRLREHKAELVLLAIMPWNFPYWQVFRAAAPALMAGNVVVLKHAANVTGAALTIEEIFRASGLPDGVFATLIVGSKEMEPIVLDERIAAVTLTGSEAAGSSVGAAAGKAIKKTVMELGGSDYFLVLAGADLERAAAVGVKSRFQNTGQSCIAAKRFIVEDGVYDRFATLFVAKARELKVGDPADRATTIGPLARADLRDELAKQVRDTLDGGATLLLGGEPLDRPGAYFAPPSS